MMCATGAFVWDQAQCSVLDAVCRYRMGSWMPWNAGNLNGDVAQTGYWQQDLSDFEQRGVMWVPEIWPG